MNQSTATAATLKIDRRTMRAKAFAAQITRALQDFLPADGRTLHRIHDLLAAQAYETNALIVRLPPEFDHLCEHEAERAMIERMLAPLVVKPGD